MNRQEIVRRLQGVFPPVVTPFNRRGDVDEAAFRANVERYAGIGLGGIVVAGSTGEAPYLTERERLRLVELARAILRPPELLLAGTGLESTRETLRLSREAVARGADALLVVTPGYYKSRMDAAALQAHYRAVADGVRRPILVYSIPQFTGVHVATPTVAALSRHPNIVGLKESSGNIRHIRRVLREARRGFRVLVGSAVIFLQALRAGASGAVLGQAGFAPDLCVGLYEAFRSRRLAEARDLQRRLVLLAAKISLPYGVAGVKAALDAAGYRGGDPRLPLTPLSPAERKRVAAAIREWRAGLEF